MEDLEPDGILYGKDNISTEEAFAFYSQEPAFAGVCLAQFKEQLKVHRKHGNEQRVLAQQEMTALLHDRVLFPRMSHNARGEPVFDLSEAKAFLKEDVSNNLHLTMTPCNLQKTRQVYMAFKPDIFKDRICQAVWLAKYFNYLDDKRKEDLKKKKQNPNHGRKFSSGNDKVI